MYEEILKEFFKDKEKIAQEILDRKEPKKIAEKETRAISFEVSKVIREHKEEQVRRAARSKKKPKDGAELFRG